MQSITEVLGPEGPFARLLDGFAPRAQQQAMAEAVATALDEGSTLVAEAGTGTGKTFAYLVPAILSGGKVIISTGTKNLQDQLYHKDLPLVRKALGVACDTALLKGRGNYLCVHRLELALDEGRFASRTLGRQLQEVRKWVSRTDSGDIAELTELPEDWSLWPQVTSTADNCLGSDCDYWDECFLTQARRRAQEADLLVVNHHLLFADMALRDEGFGELLPGANAFILDEAHQLPETASSFFGIGVSANQIWELCRDAIAEDLREAGEDPQVRRAAEVLEKEVRDLRLCFPAEPRRGPWRELDGFMGVAEALSAVGEALEALKGLLEPLAARGKGLESCARRVNDIHERFQLLSADAPEGYIHWYETHTRSLTLNLTPLDVAELFARQMQEKAAAWIFTSATLAVGDSFEHFSHRLGLEDAHCERWDSPFDYPNQSLLYVPPDMPEPNSADYTLAVVEQARRVLRLSRGRAFILFTSHRALRQAAELLADSLDYPLLIQGDAPRARLLEQFREKGDAVLLGTGSFWEGVDVRGEALSCVIIDKLPFASPGDPILQARIDAMRSRGGNPFFEYQLPQAVITLKQGVGRLIRDVSDSGVLVLCDPRLGSRGYGRTFIDSLPPMSKTRKLEVVERFFAREGELG